MERSFKYKLKPTVAQRKALERTLSLCRALYNAAVAERRMLWQQRGVSLSYYDQKAELPSLTKALPEFTSVHSQMLQDVILRVERTYAAYFRRRASGDTPGYLRFQGEGRYQSFTYRQFGNGVFLETARLLLCKFGAITVRWSRPLEGTPKTVTVRQEPDGWYVCFACTEILARPLPLTGSETGIDLGLATFLVTADGAPVANPRFMRRAEKALKKAHRQVSRRKQGSNRRRKAARCLAQRYAKLRRQRADFHHKTALALVRTYDTIYYGT